MPDRDEGLFARLSPRNRALKKKKKLVEDYVAASVDAARKVDLSYGKIPQDKAVDMVLAGDMEKERLHVPITERSPHHHIPRPHKMNDGNAALVHEDFRNIWITDLKGSPITRKVPIRPGRFRQFSVKLFRTSNVCQTKQQQQRAHQPLQGVPESA